MNWRAVGDVPLSALFYCLGGGFGGVVSFGVLIFAMATDKPLLERVSACVMLTVGLLPIGFLFSLGYFFQALLLAMILRLSFRWKLMRRFFRTKPEAVAIGIILGLILLSLTLLRIPDLLDDGLWFCHIVGSITGGAMLGIYTHWVVGGIEE